MSRNSSSVGSIRDAAALLGVELDNTNLADKILIQYNITSGKFEYVPVASVGVTDHDGLTNNGGAGSHAVITSHIADGLIHLTDAQVSSNSDVTANTADRHIHSNKALLDTYTQTEADIADAIAKKHAHANSAALDLVSGTNTGDQDLSSLVTGPASATDNAIARYDLATGKLIQNSAVTIEDTGDLLPVTTKAQDLGNGSFRWDRVRGQLLNSLAGTATTNMTEPVNVNHGGLIAVNSNGSGTNNVTLNGGSFPAISAIGNVATSLVSGTATLESKLGGAIAFGSAYAYGSGTALVSARGFSSFTAGYAYGSGTSTLEATSSGSLAFGYANGKQSGSFGRITSSGNGSFATGFATSGNTSTALIQASGNGAFAAGNVVGASTFTSSISATGNGAFAQGFSNMSGVSGPTTTSILASGKGSFAQGYVKHGVISATATNAVQFGLGTNSTANSFQMSDGFRIEATGIACWLKEIATPATPPANAHALYFSNASPLDKMRILDDAGNIRIVPDVATQQVYTPTNVVTDRAYDANSTSINELADVLGSLIADLQASGIIA